MPFPWLPVAGFLLDRAISAGSNIYSNESNVQAVRETNQANRQLAEYQYSKNLEMWHRQNAYNSPEAQMGRLRMAGLNPNLVATGGGAAGGTAAHIPSYQAPRMEAPRVDYALGLNLLGAYQDFQLKSAQIDQVRANARLKSDEADALAEIESYLEPDGALGGAIVSRSRRAQRLRYQIKAIANKGDLDYQELVRRKAANKGGLGVSQAAAASARVRQLNAAIEKLDADTELQRKRSEWFVASQLGGLVPKAFGVMKALFGGGRGATAAGRARGAGTLRALANKKFVKP